GVPTDVNVVPGFGFSVDETRYRPVKGGSLISNGIIYDHEGEPSIGVGTFGCTASRITDGDVMLLTNWHVLMANGADIGSPVFQPPRFPLPGGSIVGLPRKPDYDENKIAEIAGYAILPKVDAA